MTAGFHATDRTVIRIAGPEARDFLQGLVTNDVRLLDAGPVYAAMLSPQGKYLFDFVLIADEGDVLVDVKADRAAALMQRLAMYRLRTRVEIAPTELAVILAIGAAAPAGRLVVPDPRDSALGWRLYTADAAAALAALAPLDPAEWHALRVRRGVPETGVELLPEDSYILEAGFERLHGVDFRKGCYVGQEVTARMKHKAELRKGLARVRVEGPPPPPGTAITADGRPAGTLFSVAGGLGLAHLRYDRAGGAMQAGAARLTRLE